MFPMCLHALPRRIWHVVHLPSLQIRAHPARRAFYCIGRTFLYSKKKWFYSLLFFFLSMNHFFYSIRNSLALPNDYFYSVINSFINSFTLTILSIRPTLAPQNINPSSTFPFTASIRACVIQYGILAGLHLARH